MGWCREGVGKVGGGKGEMMMLVGLDGRGVVRDLLRGVGGWR